MASKAPFGTDLQPKFHVRVVAGKLIHTPLLTTNKDKTLSAARGKARSKDTSISGTIQARRQLKEAQGHVTMDRQREGVGRPRSKRARSLDILPILEEGAVEAIEEPSPLKVANTAQKTISKSECILPSIVVQTAATHPLSTVEHVEQSVARLRAKELVTVLFKPMVNKLAVVEDVRQSCNHADHTHFGVLSKELVLNTFKSHGIKISENDLSKLCELIPCSMGKDHVMYDKLCTTVEQILNKTYLRLDMDNSNNILTPLGSIGSGSSDSITDYDLGCSLPLLADRTNLFHHTSPFEKPLTAKPKVSRSLNTHPLCNSHKKITPKLPLIHETAGNLNNKSTSLQRKTAPVDKIEISAQASWPLSMEERENGVEKMCKALRSCTDSEGESTRYVT